MRVGAAVFQRQAHFGFAAIDFAKYTGFQLASELEQLGAGLGDVHIDGVELADGGEGLRLVGSDQSTGQHGR